MLQVLCSRFCASVQMDTSLADQSVRLQKSLKGLGNGFDKGYGGVAFEIHRIAALGRVFFQYLSLCAWSLLRELIWPQKMVLAQFSAKWQRQAC